MPLREERPRTNGSDEPAEMSSPHAIQTRASRRVVSGVAAIRESASVPAVGLSRFASALSEAVGVARPLRPRPVRPGWMRRRPVSLALVALGLVAAAAGAFLAFAGDVPGLNTVARIDANAFDEPIPVGDGPNGIAFAGGSGWVTNEGNQTVQRFDPDTGETGSATPTQGVPTGIAGGPDGVFIATEFGSRSASSQVLQVNLDTSQVEPVCDLPSSTIGIAEGGGFVWVTVPNTGDVWRLDPTRCHHERIHLADGADPGVITAGGDPLQVWVGDEVAETVYRIDAGTLDVHPIGVSGAPSTIALGSDSVWISMDRSDEVVRLDASSGRTRERIAVDDAGCDGPQGVAVGARGVWVGCHGSGVTVMIDPKTNEVFGTLDVRGTPDAVVADADGNVWVSVHRP